MEANGQVFWLSFFSEAFPYFTRKKYSGRGNSEKSFQVMKTGLQLRE